MKETEIMLLGAAALGVGVIYFTSQDARNIAAGVAGTAAGVAAAPYAVGQEIGAALGQTFGNLNNFITQGTNQATAANQSRIGDLANLVTSGIAKGPAVLPLSIERNQLQLENLAIEYGGGQITKEQYQAATRDILALPTAAGLTAPNPTVAYAVANPLGAIFNFFTQPFYLPKLIGGLLGGAEI